MEGQQAGLLMGGPITSMSPGNAGVTMPRERIKGGIRFCLHTAGPGAAQRHLRGSPSGPGRITWGGLREEDQRPEQSAGDEYYQQCWEVHQL